MTETKKPGTTEGGDRGYGARVANDDRLRAGFLNLGGARGSRMQRCQTVRDL